LGITYGSPIAVISSFLIKSVFFPKVSPGFEMRPKAFPPDRRREMRTVSQRLDYENDGRKCVCLLLLNNIFFKLIASVPLSKKYPSLTTNYLQDRRKNIRIHDYDAIQTTHSPQYIHDPKKKQTREAERCTRRRE
jgi:hypothetical protein